MAALTGCLRMPYLLDRIREHGLGPALCNPNRDSRPKGGCGNGWMKSHTLIEHLGGLWATFRTMSSPLRVVRSPLVDDAVFNHGFPERTGGVSIGEYRASLNLSASRGGNSTDVEENRRRVGLAAGFNPSQLVVTKHVHGTDVWRVDEPLPSPPQFDGMISNQPGVVLGAFAADCLPLVFADANARVCGAAHAGWRGTVNRIAVNLVTRMSELGATPHNIICIIGPSIGPCCFEVGDEVVAEFRRAFGDPEGLVVQGPNKHHIDLRVATRIQLEKAGLSPNHIDSSLPCTMCNPTRFFSYRRDGAETGTHMGFICLRDE